jgi:hypothetical protein
MPTFSDGQSISSSRDAGRGRRAGVLTPAQARAQVRSTPLTPAQFKVHRRAAEQRTVPLRALLRRPSSRG